MRKWYTHEPDTDATDIDHDFAQKKSYLLDLIRERTRKLAKADPATQEVLKREIDELETQVDQLDQEKIKSSSP